MPVHQWEARPDEKLAVPEVLWRQMHWRFTIVEGSAKLHGHCESFIQHDSGAVQLVNCLCDTSQVVSQVTLTKRLTHRSELWCFSVPVVIVKTNDDE